MSKDLFQHYRRALGARDQRLAGQAQQRAVDVPAEYARWRSTRHPEHMDILLASQPVQRAIKAGLTSYAGGRADSPLLQSHARKLAVQAIKNFDPEGGAGLSNWVQTHMQGLQRYAGQVGSPITIPERVQIEGRALRRAADAYRAENGVDPTDDQLADLSGLSHKRIAHIRDFEFQRMTEGQERAAEGSESSTAGMKFQQDPDAWESTWTRMFRNDLSDTDRKIFDARLGLGNYGAPVPVGEIAKEHGLSPAAISKRSKNMATAYAEGLEHKDTL